jgi:flagellar assembly protein FliH
VIKKREFESLFTPVRAGDESDAAAAASFSSHPAQIERLQAELERLRRDQRAAVEAAEERGRQTATRAAQERFEHAARAMTSAADEIRRRATEEVGLVERDVARLSAAIATKIVRREIAADGEFVQRLVRRCLRKVVGASRVTVRVHPSEHARIVEAQADLLGEGTPGLTLAVVVDRRVDRGGCIIETPNFVVDGRVRAQQSAACEAMMGEIE